MQGTSSVLPVEIRVRKLYGRFLSAWAIDLMALRRQGLATPTAREADDALNVPSEAMGVDVRWTRGDWQRLLTWRPTVGEVRAAA